MPCRGQLFVFFLISINIFNICINYLRISYFVFHDYPNSPLNFPRSTCTSLYPCNFVVVVVTSLPTKALYPLPVVLQCIDVSFPW